MSKQRTVYDFLYIDRERLVSYLAQLDGEGLLQTAVNTAGSEKSEGTATHSGSLSEARKKKYNSRYTMPVEAIERLEKSNLISSHSTDWRIGVLGRLSGAFRISDAAYLKGSWDLAVKGLLEGFAKDAIASIFTEQDNIVTGTFEHGSVGCFCSFEENCWTINPTRLALSHGHQISGEWTVLGLIDALPENENYKAPGDDFEEIAATFDLIAGTLREFLGRRSHHFGIIPLVIYREILRSPEPVKS